MLHFDHTARPRCGRRSLRDDGTKARANSFVAAMPPHPGCAAPKHSLNPPLKKEGRRSAKRRTVRATSCDAARAFAPSFPKLEKTGALGPPGTGRARLSAPHRGFDQGFTPGSARAALPGITGCKREDPLRHQCSEHLAVRSRAGRDDAQTARLCSVWLHSRDRPRSASRSTLAKSVLRERDIGHIIPSQTVVTR
jgi:hypothetical protein